MSERQEPATGFEVRCARRPDGTHVFLRGEADLACADELRRLVVREAAHGGRLVVDCAELAFIDCRAIGALMHGRDAAVAASGTLAVVNVRGIVDRIFRLLRIEVE